MAPTIDVLMIDGNDKVALFTARCLAQVPGLNLHILARSRATPLAYSRHKASFTVAPMETDDQRFEAVQRVVKRHHPHVMLAIREQGIRFMAAARPALSELAALVPTPTVDAFDTAVDKWLLADFLTQRGIPCPPTLLHTAGPEFEEQLESFEFPVLIKPRLGSFGQGIQRFDTAADLLNFMQTVPPETYAVQSFIPGGDIDCSVLCQDGDILAYTIQKGFLPRPDRFAAPAGIEFLYDEQVYTATRDMMAALKWTGIAHVDLRYDERDGSVKVVEINPRYWASITGSLMAGVNFPYLAAQAGLGCRFPLPEYQPIHFVAADVGLIQKFRQPQAARFAWRETDLKYALADPMAELYKLKTQFARRLS